MNTKPLTLTEVSKLLDELDPMTAMNDDRIQQFIEVVESSGKDLLKERGTEYLSSAGDFLLASSIMEFLSKGDIQESMLLFNNTTFFKKLVCICFVYAVGLGVVEELH